MTPADRYGGRTFPMKKFGKKLAGKKFRQAKIWREHVIRSENESKPENLGSKMGPESEILRNSPEFRSDFPTKHRATRVFESIGAVLRDTMCPFNVVSALETTT
jgi:hypothetical protein